ncbi:hypothetical protein H6P81_006585 [Aristolochia fimbriata]|uniref:DUF674 domain-containing protein n=1 Tax=Aristolochia fimbriata TaxID=158543 RepID=A0AAV7EYY0_ARIFI|nr:hypothetical protein H6P81_006585 [Aristolochia fimbriata]
MASKLSLKLLILKSQKKVLPAEADKGFIDFVFSLMALPVGSIIRLLKKQQMVGCIGNIYQSVENLNETYVESDYNKDFLLNPSSALPRSGFSSPLLLENRSSQSSKTYYTCICNNGYTSTHVDQIYLSHKVGTVCRTCRHSMQTQCVFVDSDSTNTEALESGGFVKGVVTYTIMDDLTVSPMSSISNITLLNKFQVADLADLEEKMVDVEVKERVVLASLSLLLDVKSRSTALHATNSTDS